MDLSPLCDVPLHIYASLFGRVRVMLLFVRIVCMTAGFLLTLGAFFIVVL